MRMSVRGSAAILVTALFALALSASGEAANYDEYSQGDLSGNGAAPTPLGLIHGANLLTATSGNGDYDMLRITIPANHQLDTLVLSSYSGATQSFVGIQNGGTWTAGTGVGVNEAALLGWTHFGPFASGAGVGQDLLDNLATSKSLFTPPLGAGVYTMLFQDTGGAVDYVMRFNVTFHPVNAPGDFDGDGFVDGFDLAIWRDEFGFGPFGDADGDLDTDGSDFLLWQQNVGTTPAAAVPEPSVRALLMLGGGLLVAMKRQRVPARMAGLCTRTGFRG
jgi:hypothetical protein